ncbi:MAG: glycosyltransferase family 2 protein [Pirellulales bacterium]|nr:glycosyltransferase family 2 protein [Pirellulales bacterium]
MIAVMPMAGRGSRFADVGIATPKPLIPVRGKPMYAWAMDSLPLSLVERVVFICLREHLEGRALRDDIQERYGDLDPVIIGLDHVTEGQACTVLVARELINTDEPLLIYNADTYCRTSLEETLPGLSPSVAGLLGVFEAPGDKWSFARTDETGRVVETSEKRRISPWACTGLYHFARGHDFVAQAEAMIAANDRVNNEFYVAPVYNRLIAQGAEIRLDVAREVWVLGTPEDLAYFEANYRG